MTAASRDRDCEVCIAERTYALIDPLVVGPRCAVHGRKQDAAARELEVLRAFEAHCRRIGMTREEDEFFERLDAIRAEALMPTDPIDLTEGRFDDD